MRLARPAPALLLLAAACGGGAETGPLAPPVPGITAALAHPAVAGEATWLDVTLPGGSTATPAWASADTTVLVIDAAGRVFPRRTGSTSISVTAGALSTTVPVTVAARPDSFRVAYRFRWTPTAAERAVFEQAAARWQRFLRQAAPATTDVAQGACLPGTSAESITQQGVTILVDRFDDAAVAPGVSGTAAPCVVDEQGRTRVGVLTLRRSVGELAGTGSAAERLLAEQLVAQGLGRALGLTGHAIVGVARPELDTTTAGDPRWTGTRAVAAFQARGGSGSVPLTTDLLFWREQAATAGEIMLPSLGTTHALTALALGALGDRGYTIDATRPEPVRPAAAVAAVATRTVPGIGVWRGKVWKVR